MVYCLRRQKAQLPLITAQEVCSQMHGVLCHVSRGLGLCVIHVQEPESEKQVNEQLKGIHSFIHALQTFYSGRSTSLSGQRCKIFFKVINSQCTNQGPSCGVLTHTVHIWLNAWWVSDSRELLVVNEGAAFPDE